MQLPLFEPPSDWKPPSLSDLPSWEGIKRVGLDTETCDPYLKQLGPSVRRGGYVVGASIAFEDGPSFYLPIRHQGGDNLPAENVIRYISENAKKHQVEVVGANLSYDLDYLMEEGVEFHHDTKFLDIQVAEPLIYELHNSYSLQNIAQRHGFEGKDEELLKEAAKIYGVSPKGGMWRLPARFVGPYAERDAVEPLKILRRQELEIERHNLWDIWRMETDVLPILVDLRRRGVRIDETRLSQLEDHYLSQEAEALQKVFDLTGHRIQVGDVHKAGALAPALEHIGMTLDVTPKTGKPQIDADALKSVDHDVPRMILRARKMNKMRTTFCESIKKHIVRGRVHCTFNQIARENEAGDQKGARYGRLSSVDPNLQQQPSPDKDPEVAGEWRTIYIPEEGGTWGCLDYSQQEPRWTTHFAAVCDLDGAREAAQAYHDNPNLDNHQFMSDLTGIPRKRAKNIYLGLCYGEGGAKMCRELDLPTRWALRVERGQVHYFDTQEEAFEARREHGKGFLWEAAGAEGQAILDQFDERAPFIRQLAKLAEDRARSNGFVRTIGKRRLNFPDNGRGEYDWTHKALNRIIQGSSADQMKIAMIKVWREMPNTWINLQVHDELDGTFSSEKEALQVAQIMKEAVPAMVPFRVDVEMGPNWGEIKDIAA
jgi:DNA polymerase I-like protein with 3'-5' exonuclease and polymerase domains